MTLTLDFSADQLFALEAVREWRDGFPSGPTQTFTMGGLAGTGKSTLVSYLVASWPAVATVALAGKAAHVLRQKGVAGAQTAHSLIYQPYEDDEGKVRYMRRARLENIRTIIVDEASMIDEWLCQDLLSYRLPVLFVGDHGQLEPIGRNPGLMAEPQVKLERIHRQAAGNPILRLAAAFREGRAVPRSWADPKGRVRLAGQREFDRLVSPDVQIIVGRNKTRHAVNRKVRAMLGREGVVCPGDRLIVLKNNKQFGIFNGQQVTALGVIDERGSIIEVEIETDDGRCFTLPCHRPQFGADAITDWKSQDVALADYGYALTAHKAQGSEFGDVLALEEIASGWDARRWRYTVATRAKERLTYCA